MSAPRRFTSAAALVLACAFALSSPAGAQCDYDDITAGSTYSFSHLGLPRITQSANYWTAISVRPPSTDDWDIGLYSTTAAFPTCVSGPLATSAAGGNVTDFIVGDFNAAANPIGSYIARVNRFSGVGTTAYVQWDSGTDALTVNDFPIARSTTALAEIECWDVFLTGGQSYTFTLSHSGPAALKVMLFRNPANAPYWAGRSARVLETATSGTYLAPATDWYGVVVVNDNGGDDNYLLSVGTCEAPVALTSAVPQAASGPSVNRSFAQASNYYTAVAVRSNDTNQDWDLEVYGNPTGSAYPTCFSTLRASSAFGSNATDFVVGDFNTGANPLATNYARAYPYGITTSPAQVEWDSGMDVISVDAPPLTRTTGPGDLIECWDVFLNGGQNFGINFTHEGAADLKVMVFHNPGAGYWVGRGAANYTASGNGYYFAPTSDWYSVVVVNDNGGTGTYKLGMAQCVNVFSVPSGGSFFSTPNGWLEIHPTLQAWTVFGAVSSPDETVGNWDTRIYRDGTGGLFPYCPSTLLAQSTLPAATVDFVVGDFHVNTPGYYYPVNVQLGGPNVKFTWDGDDQALTVGDPPVVRNGGYLDLVEVWDVWLEAGRTYSFQLHSTLGTQRQVLMRNPGVSPYWAGRAAAEFDAPSGDHEYMAPATGWYGLVTTCEVVNSFNEFTLGVFETAVAVEPGPGLQTRFASAMPNPTRSAVTFDFELREEAVVEFEVRDVAGRMVAHLPLGRREAGRGAYAWNGATDDGRHVAAGVYFVKMKTTGRPVGNATVVMLR